MTIDDLNNNLNKIIKDYEAKAEALRSFKAEILTYLDQH